MRGQIIIYTTEIQLEENIIESYMATNWAIWKKLINSQKHKLPKLKEEEIENLNRPVTNKKTESVITTTTTTTKNSTKKTPGPDDFTGKLYQASKKKLLPILLKLLKKIEMEGKYPNSFFETVSTVIPKAD